MRIISLVPSITELLHDLGLQNEVIGITKFCVHPEKWFRTKERIGGTKNINIEKIKLLQPDLVIASKEENIQQQVDAIMQFCKVCVTDVKNYNDALEMIKLVGILTGKAFLAKAIIEKIELKFSNLRFNELYKAVYLIWKAPWMTVGGDTFIHSMMQKAGFSNLFENKERYPETNINELIKLQPKHILLSTEPYPFKQTHCDELFAYFSKSKIILVDGEMFSWYGSRMMFAADYFKQLSTKL